MPVAYQSGAPTAVTRRKFYVGMIYGLWSLMAAALSIPAAIYLLRRLASFGWLFRGKPNQPNRLPGRSVILMQVP